MGAQASNSGGANYDSETTFDESPVHSVTLSSYYFGQTEVTQGLWDAVMGTGSSSHGTRIALYGLGSNYPAYYISYNDVQSFITQLNALTGMNFRMPTEAEWEYAARGGNQSHGYKFSGSNTIDNVAWYSGNSGESIHPVASKQANELGIYDMTGNACEWCSDWYGDYSDISQTNPTGPGSGTTHVNRSGSRSFIAHFCHTSDRLPLPNDSGIHGSGMRLVLSEQHQLSLFTLTKKKIFDWRLFKTKRKYNYKFLQD